MTVYYSKEHEWVRVEGDTATVGITDYAQGQLGDVVFVELPAVGKALVQGKDAAVVESVKAASEVYAPISGSVTEVNDALEADPSLVNSAAETDGWFFRMSIGSAAELSDLMEGDAYAAFCADL